MHCISSQRRCQGNGHCHCRRAGLGRGDGHGAGAKEPPAQAAPHCRHAACSPALPAALAGEAKLPQGRTVAGSRALTTGTRGWRGLVPHRRLSQGLQNGSSGFAARPPALLCGPGGCWSCPPSPRGCVCFLSQLLCSWTGTQQLPSSGCGRGQPGQEKKEKNQQNAPSAPPPAPSPDAVNFH